MPQSQSSGFLKSLRVRQLAQAPVDAVYRLRYFLDQNHVVGEIRLPCSSHEMAQNREVESYRLRGAGDPLLNRLRGLFQEQSQRTFNSLFVIVSPQVLDHWSMRNSPPAQFVQAGRQDPDIAVAEIGFLQSMSLQAGQDSRRNSRRAITSPSKPNRVDVVVLRIV